MHLPTPEEWQGFVIPLKKPRVCPNKEESVLMSTESRVCQHHLHGTSQLKRPLFSPSSPPSSMRRVRNKLLSENRRR